MYVAAAAVSEVTVSNETVTTSTFTLTWMEISLTSSDFSHYTVFYLPVRGPYGPIMANNRRKRQSTQAGELTMNFTGTTGTLANLYGAVTYRIQVAAVGIFNGQDVIGDRSAAVEITTSEGGEKIFGSVYLRSVAIIPLQYLLFLVISITIILLTLVLYYILH